MLAFIEITLNVVSFAAVVVLAAAFGFLVNRKQLSKQKSSISKLEIEMLQSHSEILQLQKELSDKDNPQSKTPIFSIRDAAAEASQEQLTSARLSKKIVGGGKSTS